MAETLAIRWGSVQAGRAVIDCDLHNVVPSAQALFPWLSDFWREYITQSGFKGPNDTPYPKAPTSARPGTTPAAGPPGSDLALRAGAGAGRAGEPRSAS